ncbi:MAG: DUF2891 domain-containing protein [Bacteroidales bacterium]|nr:DUF2891 domain-containing protein [Bacteroidales bacterium]MCF8390505.1 DUF2891 domain-containing protein [Bacteroidales bacterium]
MKKLCISIFLSLILILFSCNNDSKEPKVQYDISKTPIPLLDLSQANRLANLPIACIVQEYPNKLGQVIGSASDLKSPAELHPAFYGCFDWHSSVHGHWSLVRLLKEFPDLDGADTIKVMLAERISAKNILKEVEYFLGEHNTTYERTYGWAWLLKLAEELETWEVELAKELSANLKPLTNLIVNNYIEFLPKLQYPIREGTHSNTAFGLSFAYDYALISDNEALKSVIEESARNFYTDDKNCPMNWEPGGYDFLSPCLQEADIMRKVLNQKEFEVWLKEFLPELSNPEFTLQPGIVNDRTDGQLVHLDGVNFSRAWCLYGLARNTPDLQHLNKIADDHIIYSLSSVTDGNYEGGHWLASFAIYALKERG